MRSARVAVIVVVAAIAGFLAAEWLWPVRGEAPAPPAAPMPAPAVPPPGPAPVADSPAPLPATSDALRVESGGTIAIDAATLEPGRPVVLHLVLGEPSKSAEPRPVRILAAEGGRSLEGLGSLGDERTDARFEIDPAFLLPGRYIVEVKTTELSHFPLRRYVLEVR